MTTSAIVMMTLSMVLVWGGLALSIVHLMRRPQVEELPDPDQAQKAAEAKA